MNHEKISSIRKESVFKLTTGRKETKVTMKATENCLRSKNGKNIS